MAKHIFKPLFNTVTFFLPVLLFIPLVKSPTSCHHLQENVRGLVAACACSQLSGGEEPRTSASCSPACRTGEAAEAQAYHQNDPPQKFTAILPQQQPHSRALSLLFPCLLPDKPGSQN